MTELETLQEQFNIAKKQFIEVQEENDELHIEMLRKNKEILKWKWLYQEAKAELEYK